MRRAKAWVDAREILRQQSVSRHGHEDSRLTQLENQEYRREAGERTRADQRLRPWLAGKGCRDGSGVTEIDSVFFDPREHSGRENVKHGADNETGDHPDRQIALRMFGFLSGGGDGIEADESKKDNRRAAHHAAKSTRGKWMPVRRVNHECAEGDD